jgi:calcium-dependent protein kinase
LKLENFLYDTQGGTHLKLIDFGFSKFFDTKSRMHTSCGTLAYVAPEVLKKSYTSQCDLWSMGVIVFILLSGHMPFFGKESTQMQDISEGHYVMQNEHWKGVSNAGKRFVRALLEVSPEKRLTAKTALQHAWLTTHCQEPQLDLKPMVSALRSWSAAPKLLRACMCMMAWTLTNEQQAAVRDQFLVVDSNHDGAVSLAELRAVMVDKYQVPEEEVTTIFSIFVAAHDQACEHIELDEDLLHITFSKFDTKGVGSISAQDFHEVLGASLEDGHAEAFVREADRRGSGRIDYQDFVEYTRSSRRTMKQQIMGIRNQANEDVLSPSTYESRAPTLLEAPRRSDFGVETKAIKNAPLEFEHSITPDLEMKDACCILM